MLGETYADGGLAGGVTGNIFRDPDIQVGVGAGPGEAAVGMLLVKLGCGEIRVDAVVDVPLDKADIELSVNLVEVCRLSTRVSLSFHVGWT